MPDVGLTTANEPVSPDEKVVIRYTVEVGGLPVYAESYDVEKLTGELAADRARVAELWLRRLEAVVACRHEPRFSACVTAFVADGAVPGED